jgi:hypothetical protein
MLNGPTDPRRDLTTTDLLALAEGLTIAFPHIPEADLGRYQALAWKLTTIVMRMGRVDNAWQLAHRA